jgi:hypothetical protein
VTIQGLLITATGHGVFLSSCFISQGIIQAWGVNTFTVSLAIGESQKAKAL